MPRPVKIDRDQALSKAMELFWIKGYEASSVQQLLDTMGMNSGSMYSAFGGKRALFVACIELYASALNFMVEELLRKPDNPVGAISNFLKATLIHTPKDIQQRGCLIVNTITEEANNDDELVTLAARKQCIIIDALEDRITEGQKTGLISNHESANNLANFLVNNIHGLRVTGRIPENDTSHVDSMIRIALGVLDVK